MNLKVLNQLQYGTANNFGKNYCIPPSRIVPISFKEISEIQNHKNILYYVTPQQENKFIMCEKKGTLFEPSSYFSPPHTFLKSFLFLTSKSFYMIMGKPKERQDFIMRFLKDKMSILMNKTNDKKEKRDIQKFMQKIFYIKNDIEYDTDPFRNKYFKLMCKAIHVDKISFVVVHTDNEGYYKDITPKHLDVSKINSSSNEYSEKYLIMLQLPNSNFSPCGISYG